MRRGLCCRVGEDTGIGLLEAAEDGAPQAPMCVFVHVVDIIICIRGRGTYTRDEVPSRGHVHIHTSPI